jgi:hypothetical protein
VIHVDDGLGGDTVDCGGGDEDEVRFDRGDTVLPSCETQIEV